MQRGGRRPFGYEPDRLTIRPEEAAVIADAAERVMAGASAAEVASDLNRRGVVSVTGALWTATTVRRLLSSARIAGWVERAGRLVEPAPWPAIIGLDDHLALRHLLDGWSDAPATGARIGLGVRARSYLLTGFVFCGRCGAAMVARPGRTGRRLMRRYTCAADRGGCNRVGVAADPLEAFVTEELLRRDQSGRRPGTPRGRSAKGSAAGRLVLAEARLGELAASYAEGRLSRAEWEAARSAVAESAAVHRRAVVADACDAAADASRPLDTEEWESLSFGQRRTLLARRLTAITILPSPSPAISNRFSAGRVAIDW